MSYRDMMDVLLRTDNKSKLAAALGVSRPTFDRYKKNPESVPIGKVQTLARLKGYRLELQTIPHTYT